MTANAGIRDLKRFRRNRCYKPKRMRRPISASPRTTIILPSGSIEASSTGQNRENRAASIVEQRLRRTLKQR